MRIKITLYLIKRKLSNYILKFKRCN